MFEFNRDELNVTLSYFWTCTNSKPKKGLHSLQRGDRIRSRTNVLYIHYECTAFYFEKGCPGSNFVANILHVEPGTFDIIITFYDEKKFE